VAKPEEGSLESVRDELLAKCAVVRSLRLENLARPEHARPAPLGSLEPPRVVAIGASTGGPRAVQELLAMLPGSLPVGLLVAQHMPATFTRAFADRLARTTPFGAVEAGPDDLVATGRVLVAPGGQHLEVRRDGAGTLRASLAPLEADGFAVRYCPSIDRLFTTAAAALGPRLCAVVLTGMGSDGRDGIQAVKRAGGLTLAESEETAVVYGMPQSAAATGAVDEVLGLPALAERLVRFARGA
jgi:two-component system chemotaxis response regulator CheB